MNIKWIGCLMTGSLLALPAGAACLFGDAYLARGQYEQARQVYENCAKEQNDPGAQYALGQLYQNGTGTPQNIKRALFYYRFAAENGLASAQRALAQLMMDLERMGAPGRVALQDYETKIGELKETQKTIAEPIKAREMSAYAWMLLAAEKADNKWFYPAGGDQDQQAVRLLPSLESRYGKSAREQAVRQASAWKEDKLLRAAKTALSDSEYATFTDTLYPRQGKPDPARRLLEVSKLKQRLTGEGQSHD